MLLLYAPGTCSLAAHVALEWCGLPYHTSRVELGGADADALRRLHPLGQVPLLRVDGRWLAEANAILVHLGRRRPERGFVPPAGTWAEAEFEHWLSWIASHLHVAFYPYFTPERYVTDPAAHDAVRDAAIVRIRGALGYVDAALVGRRSLLGDRDTLLDPYLYAIARWARKIVAVDREFPALGAHLRRLHDDPAVRFAVSVERGRAGASPSGAYRGEVPLGEVAGSAGDAAGPAG